MSSNADIPAAVIAAATVVGDWFAEHNIKRWQLGPCQSRETSNLERAQAYLPDLQRAVERSATALTIEQMEDALRSIQHYASRMRKALFEELKKPILDVDDPNYTPADPRVGEGL